MEKLTLGKGKCLETARMTSPRSALQHMGDRRREWGRGGAQAESLAKSQPVSMGPQTTIQPWEAQFFAAAVLDQQFSKTKTLEDSFHNPYKTRSK